MRYEENSYVSLFTRYTDHSDGKAVLANAIVDIASDIRAASLLDLGAGNGDLTAALAKHFSGVLAVERNTGFCRRLQQLEGVDVVSGRMEDVDLGGPHDMCLLSYSLDGVPSDRLEELLGRVLASRSTTGAVLACSYLEKCAWDVYHEYVCEKIQVPRWGGINRYVEEITKRGFSCHIRRVERTYIWGDDVDDLYDNLAFFFMENLDRYYSVRSECRDALLHLSEEGGSGSTALPVFEAIIEVRCGITR